LNTYGIVKNLINFAIAIFSVKNMENSVHSSFLTFFVKIYFHRILLYFSCKCIFGVGMQHGCVESWMHSLERRKRSGVGRSSCFYPNNRILIENPWLAPLKIDNKEFGE
jgi:hypothetical protein